jgi:hypothetical protein
MGPERSVWSPQNPQGNSCFAIAAPTAARMAHLKTMAKRRFGSSHSTAVNRKAPMKMIAEAYITASTAVIGGDAYQ